MNEPQDHVIRRSGGFYRPEAKGYTHSIAEAGRWSRTEALAYQKGVEGVTIHHVSDFKPDRLSILIQALETAAARFNMMAGVGLVNGVDPKVGYQECMDALRAVQ